LGGVCGGEVAIALIGLNHLYLAMRTPAAALRRFRVKMPCFLHMRRRHRDQAALSFSARTAVFLPKLRVFSSSITVRISKM